MDSIITNKRFVKLMNVEGLGWIDLIKGNGYFYIIYNNNATQEQKDIINGLTSTSIYIYAFNHQSPGVWVEDIKRMINI